MMAKYVFLGFAGSACALLLCASASLGQDAAWNNLSVSGTGTVNTLVSGTAHVDLLLVTGTADLQSNALLFGLSGTAPGISAVYSDGINGADSCFSLTAMRPSLSWNWQRVTGSGTSTAVAMQLDASNRLILTGTADVDPPQLILDPNEGVSMNGSNLLSRSDADSLYLPAGNGLSMLNGNVGVGTLTPGAKLDVAGNFNVASGSTSALFVNAVSGNIGIRTTTPQAALDVQGKAQISDGLVVSGTVIMKNRVAIGGTSAPLATLHVTGNQIISYGVPSGALNIGADANLTTRTSDTRKLGVIAAPDYSNTKNIELFSSDSFSPSNNRVYLGGRNGGSSYAATDIYFTTAPTTSTAGGSTRMVINRDGLVGIGTSTPQTLLDVSGNAGIAGNLTISGTTNVSGNATVSGKLTVGGTGGGIVVSGSTNVVLINPAGDLSMGDFTAGTKPQ